MAAVRVAIQRGTLKRLEEAFRGFFRRARAGRWSAVVWHAVSHPQPEDDGTAIGIDMNVGQVAASDGRLFHAPDTRRLEARRRRYQRMVARRRRCRGAGPWNREHTSKDDGRSRHAFLASPKHYDLVLDARRFPGPAGLDLGRHAVARLHGWVFVIPLTSHTSYGSIFNRDVSERADVKWDFDALLSEDSVTEFEPHAVIPLPNLVHRRIYDGAVARIGNAAGFFEPLEATGIMPAQLQVGMILQARFNRPAEHRERDAPVINRFLVNSMPCCGPINREVVDSEDRMRTRAVFPLTSYAQIAQGLGCFRGLTATEVRSAQSVGRPSRNLSRDREQASGERCRIHGNRPRIR